MTNTQPQDPGPAADAGTGAPSTDQQQPPQGFFDQIRGFGVRRSQDRWIAGVCGGIARRLGVDPLLIRAATIVLLILGIGVLAYLVAWALLPDEDGSILAERAVRDGDAWGITLLVFIGLGVFFSGPWIGGERSGLGGLFVAVAVIFGGWWLLKHRKPRHADHPTGPPPVQTGAGPTAPQAASGPQPVWSTPTPGRVGYEPPPTHESTNPYAAANTTSTSTRPRPAKAGLAGFLLVLGAAVVGYGLGMVLSGPVDSTTTVAALLGATILAGLATVLLGILGRRSALSALLSLVLAVSLLSTWGASRVSLDGGGTQSWAPTETSTRATYDINAGTGILDLRGLTERPQQPDLRASVNFGTLEIYVPEGISTRVVATSQLGSIDLVGTGAASIRESQGGATATATYLFGTDDPADADVTVTANANLGGIKIITPIEPAGR